MSESEPIPTVLEVHLEGVAVAQLHLLAEYLSETEDVPMTAADLVLQAVDEFLVLAWLVTGDRLDVK